MKSAVFGLFFCLTLQVSGQDLPMMSQDGVIELKLREDLDIKWVASMLIDKGFDIDKFSPELGYITTLEKKVNKKLAVFYRVRITVSNGNMVVKGFLTRPLYSADEMTNSNLVKPKGMSGSPQRVVSDELIELVSSIKLGMQS